MDDRDEFQELIRSFRLGEQPDAASQAQQEQAQTRPSGARPGPREAAQQPPSGNRPVADDPFAWRQPVRKEPPTQAGREFVRQYTPNPTGTRAPVTPNAEAQRPGAALPGSGQPGSGRHLSPPAPRVPPTPQRPASGYPSASTGAPNAGGRIPPPAPRQQSQQGGVPYPSPGTPPRPARGAPPQPTSGVQPRPALGTPPQPMSGAQPHPAQGVQPRPAQGAQPRPMSGAAMQPQFRGTPPASQGAGRPPAAPAAQQAAPQQKKDFQLHISNPEYRSIPEPPPGRATPVRGASSPPSAQGRSGGTGNAGGGAPPPTGRGPGGSGGGGTPPRREPSRPKRKKAGRAGRFFKALFMCTIAVAGSVFLAVFALYSMGDMLGMNKGDIKTEMVIGENETIGSLAVQLEKAGIITQPLTFEVYARLTGKDTFKPGNYKFNTKMAYSQILGKLEKGTVEIEEVQITFPEGKTIQQIAAMLEEKNVCSAEEFLRVSDTERFGYEFEDQIPEDPLRFHRLEGYIFPDTYQFYVGEKVTSVVDKFLDAFNSRVTADLYTVMQERGMTLDQTITLASVLQKEAGNLEDMYQVSSVFHNRLANPAQFPRLESDATWYYVEEEIKPSGLGSDAMFAAYDTYQCQGLPVGPINNPGKDAIKMALDPAQTSYYFFLSDQKGEYHYSATLAEHQKFLLSAGDVHGGTSIDHSKAAAQGPKQ